MANRPKGFGLSKEVADRMDAKYSDEDEQEVTAWITAITGLTPEGCGRDVFQAWLQNGQVLCKLMNTIKPGSCGKIHDVSAVKLAAMRKNKEMENISVFLKGCENYGVGRGDLFQTVDLYEGQNLPQVQATLIKLSGVAAKNGYDGPCIGVKIADANKRDFDEQKLREGRNVIGLQMGTNQVASQKGMSAYGLGRQLTPQPGQQ